MMETRILRTSLLTVAIVMLALGVASAASSCQTWSTPNIKVVSITWGNSTHSVSAAPGNRDVPLTVTLESYDTNCELQNVVATLSPYGGITDFTGASTSVVYLQDIQPPSIVNLVFHLNIGSNVSMGPYDSATYPLVLSWDSDNGSTNVQQQLNVQVPLEGAANLSFKTSAPDIIAGKITNVTISVSNTGSGIASDISTTASSSAGVSLLSQPQLIPTLAPNETKNVTLQLYIAPSQAGNSQAGASVILGLDTHYINPYGYNTSISNNLGLFASLPSPASVLVSVQNQTLVSGKITGMNLTVFNSGTDPITNLSVVLTPVSPLSIIGSDNLNTVPKISPGESANLPITLYVQSSTSAVSTLDISLVYVLDNQQVTTSRTISFLNPGNVNATLVSTVVSPSVPTPGQIFSITSTIENTGSQSATAASVSPEPPKGITILGENTTFLGSIAVDTPTAMTVSFTVSPSAKAGEYTIPVVLSYLNNLNQRQNKTFYYSVQVGSAITGASGSTVVTTSNSSYRHGNFSSSPAYYQSRRSNFLIYIAAAAVVIIVVAGGVGYYLYRKGKKAGKEKAKSEHHQV